MYLTIVLLLLTFACFLHQFFVAFFVGFAIPGQPHVHSPPLPKKEYK
jgi:hypothetical protein